MDTLLQMGISNAVVAIALALVAGTASVVWRRRPALVHGLWLLVLLKLLTPPLVRIPVPVLWQGVEHGPAVAAAIPDAGAAPEAPSLPVFDPGPIEPEPPLVAGTRRQTGEKAEASSETETAELPVPADHGSAQEVSYAAPSTSAFEMSDWWLVLQTIWAAGAIGWFILAGVRLARFARLLRHAVAAPDAVQDEADRMAVALGMRWCPMVQVLPGRLAPMVWAGFGSPRLLLPAELLDKLDAQSVNTLMAHELAHLRRGDHRVRIVEFLAMGLFWWHPVVWIARRALREAEEQCCDAWVVSVLPGAGKTYATALLETLDFLSAAPAPPPLACGIGQVSDLKRRLTMIMRGATPRALCWREGLAVLGLAMLLPLLPTLARAEPEDPVPAERSDARTVEKKVLTLRFDDKSDEGNKAKKPVDRQKFLALFDEKNDDGDRSKKSAEADKTKAELKALEADLQRKVAEVREASMRLKEAAEKLQRVEVEKAKEMAKEMAKGLTRDINREVQERVRDVQERIRREVRVEVDGQEMKGRKMIIDGPVEIEITSDGHTVLRKLNSGRVRAVPAVPAVPPVGAVPSAPSAPPAPGAAAAPVAAAAPEAVRARAAEGRSSGMSRRMSEGREDDQRIDQLERKLDAVLRELDSLRKEKGDSQKKERKPSRGKSSEEEDESL
jgi:bla regulator protein blaR1